MLYLRYCIKNRTFFQHRVFRTSRLLKSRQESTVYTLEYIAASPIEKLYTFNVTDTVLSQLQRVCGGYMSSTACQNQKTKKETGDLNKFSHIPHQNPRS